MSIIFDESEFQSGVRFSPHITEDEKERLTENEKSLLDLFRKLPEEERHRILAQMHKLLKPSGPSKKINVLKAIEEAKQSAAHENLSDIISDIVK